jgi:hypothetical protein
MFAIRRFSATLALTLGLLLLGQGAALAGWDQNKPKQGRECPDDTTQAGDSQSRKRPDCEDTCDGDSDYRSRQRNSTKPSQNDDRCKDTCDNDAGHNQQQRRNHDDRCKDTCDNDAGHNQQQRRNHDDRCEDRDGRGHKPKYGDDHGHKPKYGDDHGHKPKYGDKDGHGRYGDKIDHRRRKADQQRHIADRWEKRQHSSHTKARSNWKKYHQWKGHDRDQAKVYRTKARGYDRHAERCAEKADWWDHQADLNDRQVRKMVNLLTYLLHLLKSNGYSPA